MNSGTGIESQREPAQCKAVVMKEQFGVYNTQHLCFEHLLTLSFRALGTRGLELLLGRVVLPDEDAVGQTMLQLCLKP